MALTTALNVVSNAAEIPWEVKDKVCTQKGEYLVFAVVNNCPVWTAREREFYGKRIFVGTWEGQKE